MRIMGLVFTRGVSLEIWVNTGLITREKRIYEEHLRSNHFDKIIWFTYGVNDDLMCKQLVEKGILDERIEVIAMPKIFRGKLGMTLYSVILPCIRHKACQGLSVIKTNQMEGAWTGHLIHCMYNVPFYLRTGYTYTNLLNNKMIQISNVWQKSKLLLKVKKYEIIEKWLYSKCDLAAVSSVHDKKYICDKYSVSEKKVDVLTNYIDCNVFKPMTDIGKSEKRFIFVGRLNEEKNLYNIINAIGKLGVGLDIFGAGELRAELEAYVADNEYDVCIKGTVDNQKLPFKYNQYKYYIIASPFEGMPKTLLEAMACGLVCFGTNTSGIKEIINDKVNGYLIENISADCIRETIEKHLDKDTQEISVAAVNYIKENHSIECIVEKEWKQLKGWIERK